MGNQIEEIAWQKDTRWRFKGDAEQRIRKLELRGHFAKWVLEPNGYVVYVAQAETEGVDDGR